MLKKPVNYELPSSMGDDSGGREEWTQKDPNDVELGVVASDNSVQIKTLRDDKDDAECTHVLIPCPSHIIVDRDVNGSEDCCSDYKKKMKTSSQDIKHEEKEHPEDGTLVSELRAVPIFCAVCLVKYEISDRVCWSSNSKCSHMFHKDCILQWLATLGRTHSRAKLVSATPSKKKLLDFDLTCPCCRQDFISRKLILGGVFDCWTSTSD